MVLLESISSDEEGRYFGGTEDGEYVKIIGVPHQETVGVFGRNLIRDELDRLKRLAETDNSRYYLIQSLEEVLENKGTHKDAFAIGYVTFMI